METEKTLKYIAESLMQQRVTVSDPGLLHGKMGLVIFFFHYARYTEDPSFEDFAIALIDSIQEQILQQPDPGYAHGLAGIGTGIEYLAQNNFLAIDTDEILTDIDRYIFNVTIFSNHTDAGLFTGLTGLGRYLLFRMAGNTNVDHTGILNNKMLLIYITDMLERMSSSLKETEIKDVVGFLQDMNQVNILPVKVKRMLFLLSSGSPSINKERLSPSYEMSIETLYSLKYNEFMSEFQLNPKPDMVPDFYGGLSGFGLYLLSQLDKQHRTWMKLL